MIISKSSHILWGVVAGLGVMTFMGQGTAHAASYTWTGVSGSVWSSASNWTPTAVPQAGDSVVIGAGKAVTLSGDISLADLSVGTGSTLTITGNVTLTNSFKMRDASLLGTGTLTVAAGATGTLESAEVNPYVSNTLDCLLYNQGTLNWNSGKIVLSKDFTNQAGANWNILTDANVQTPGATKPTIYNNGTITKDITPNQTTIAVYLSNSGWINVRSGRFNVGPRYIQSGGKLSLNGGNVNGSSSLQVNGGIVDGSGTITGNVVNDGGDFKPGHSPGSITINGNFTQTANGVLDMEVGGTTPGTGYDQMIVNGTAYLDGTLNFVRYNNFVPKNGDVYTLFTYYAKVGNFAKFVDSTPTPGIAYNTTLTPTTYEVNCFTATTSTSTTTPTTTLDTTLPVVSISKPLDSSAGPTVTSVAGSASDASGIKSVTLRLYRYADPVTGAAAYWAGGTTWTATASASNERAVTGTTSWTFTLPTLAAGRYSLTATATDTTGNQASTKASSFWVDPNAPSTLSVSAPANAASVSSLAQISGSAADAANGSGIASVKYQLKRGADNLYWNGSTWSSTATSLSTTVSGTSWTNSSVLPSGTNLKAGTYSLITTATDKAGNTKSLTTSFSLLATTTASIKTG